MSVISFAELGLIEPLLRALKKEDHEIPTPIQAQAIPHLLRGCDLLGSAQTGTGKTAAFALPILQHLANGKRQDKKSNSPRALILTPTRELANQVSKNFKSYGRYLNVTHAVVFGGVSVFEQARSMPRNLDVLVATPGRLLDLISQRRIFLDNLELFTLDEADRMLDMGFIHDIRKIISKLPQSRQTLFFSATMPQAAAQLANTLLKKPVQVKVDPTVCTVEKVEQKVLFVERHNKEALLLSLLENSEINRVLVFTRTKYKANTIALKLNKHNVNAEAIHGNKSQKARMQALKRFSVGQSRVLVATDVASRGIDVKDISHVINFEIPNEPESYIHRIGRTARAGATGVAISFCDSEERDFLSSIERLIKTTIRVDKEHPYHSQHAASLKPTNNTYSFGKKRFSSRSRRSGFRFQTSRSSRSY
ncbi:MAG: DEAD/DEAH box family ATP-dependent RNA helicase [bacterium]|nr:MAG: DEAD/DEAH box family ATP-dependent RNA helicase [bacterium]